MNIRIICDFNIDNSNYEILFKIFNSAIPAMFQELLSQAIQSNAETYKRELSKKLGTVLIWKNRKENQTIKISGLYGKETVILPMLQVQRKDTGKKISLTRLMLGIKEYRQIPNVHREVLAQLGASTTFRSGRNLLNSITGREFSLDTIHRTVQEVGEKVRAGFKVEASDEPVFAADGTGIPTVEGGKLGSELKVVSQFTPDGRVQPVGMGISKNKKKGEGSWSEALSALQDLPQEFQDSMTMITDGDSSIISTLRNMVSDRTNIFCCYRKSRRLTAITAIPTIRPYME